MKHIKFAFIAIALISIFSAFTLKGTQSLTFKKYGVLIKKTVMINGVEKLVIIVKNIDGQFEGVDYICDELIETKCIFDTETQPTEGIEETDGLPYFLVTVVDPFNNLNVANVVNGEFIDLQ